MNPFLINKINEDNHKKMNSNKIEIIYNISDKDKETGKIKIFGESFVNNYKDISKIIYKNKEYELNEEFNINKDKNILKIK